MAEAPLRGRTSRAHRRRQGPLPPTSCTPPTRWAQVRNNQRLSRQYLEDAERLEEATAEVAAAVAPTTIDQVNDRVHAVIVINSQGRILVANKLACSMFGYKPDDVIGHNVSMIVPAPHAARHDGRAAALLLFRVRADMPPLTASRALRERGASVAPELPARLTHRPQHSTLAPAGGAATAPGLVHMALARTRFGRGARRLDRGGMTCACAGPAAARGVRGAGICATSCSPGKRSTSAPAERWRGSTRMVTTSASPYAALPPCRRAPPLAAASALRPLRVALAASTPHATHRGGKHRAAPAAWLACACRMRPPARAPVPLAGSSPRPRAAPCRASCA